MQVNAGSCKLHCCIGTLNQLGRFHHKHCEHNLTFCRHIANFGTGTVCTGLLYPRTKQTDWPGSVSYLELLPLLLTSDLLLHQPRFALCLAGSLFPLLGILGRAVAIAFLRQALSCTLCLSSSLPVEPIYSGRLEVDVVCNRRRLSGLPHNVSLQRSNMTYAGRRG